jgi:hypothetical protein
MDSMTDQIPFGRSGITAEMQRSVASTARVVQPPEAARWSAAEDRLYPLITVDSDLYEAAVTLVCEILDVLRSRCGTVAELCSIDPADVLRQCPAASALPALELDLGVVLDAARAHRWRDLVTDQIVVEPDD